MTRAGFPAFTSLGSVAIASAASTSSALDLAAQGQAGWNRLVVGYATFSTGAQLAVQGSADNSTWKNVFTLVPTSSTVQFQQLLIPSSVSGTGYAAMATPPFRYIRFVASDTITNGGVISIYGAD